MRLDHAHASRPGGRGGDGRRARVRHASDSGRLGERGAGARGKGCPMSDVLDRATLTARRDAVHAELLAAMQAVERYKGALAMLEELLRLEEPPGAAEDAA